MDDVSHYVPSASVTYEAAYAYLAREVMSNLALLGALEYEPVAALHGAARGAAVRALALVLEPAGPPLQRRTPVMLDADDVAALQTLLDTVVWPRRATFVIARRELLAALATHLGVSSLKDGGLLHFVADQVPARAHQYVRQLTLGDADQLDLEPCGLSPTALRNWIKRGWRAFGAVDERTLLAHALAAYPVADTEEVSAVFTAPHCRRQGLASAVVAAAIADIAAHGRRAVYACKRTNTASRQVARGLGLQLISETWEFYKD